MDDRAVDAIDDELWRRLAPLIEDSGPSASGHAPLRRELEALDRTALGKVRQLLIDRLEAATAPRVRLHPAARGAATVAKVLAMVSGEAAGWPTDPAGEGQIIGELEAERGRLRSLVARLGALDLGTGRLIEVEDAELWVHRALFVDEVLGHLEGDDEHAALYLEAAKHLGFEIVQTAELQSVWGELALLHRLGLFDPRAIRPYLEMHGLHRATWALAKLGERLEQSPELAARLGERPDFASALALI